MDEKIRREEMSDIDAMNAMEEIDRISTGEGADELNGVWSSAGPRGISDGVMNSMEQIPPDEFEQGQPAEPMRERRGAGGGIWRAVGRIGVPVLLAVALAATAVWGDGQRALAEGYKQSSENMYRRAFTELCDDMSNMQTALGKLRVAGSGGQYMLLLDDIWRLSGSCVSLMSQIPSSHIDTAELNSFVVRIGDYARALSKKALNDEERTAEDEEQLTALYDSCARISRELNDRLSIGDVPTAAVSNEGYYESAYADEVKQSDDIDKFPTLIYDGPFSESSEKREAKGLGTDEIDRETARATAEKLTGTDRMEDAGETEGTIASWDFTATDEQGRETGISIAKRGGKMVWFMGSAAGGENQMPDEATRERMKQAALEWLGKAGFDDMRATYAQYYSGAGVINFAATKDDIILYNDLVKVWVDIETNEVIGADARNYLFSHTEREMPTPAVSPEEAEAKVSVNLEIESRELALIPITVETERLCYEFKGRCGEDEYIVYIDAQTGAEQQIFVIINTENGQLTA